MMHRTFGSLVFSAALLCALPAAAGAQSASPTPAPSPAVTPAAREDASAKPATSPVPSPTPSETPGPPLGNIKWREIGPALPGGRVTSVAGSDSDPNLYFFGSAGGGVWKSTDGAETWNPVFEKQAVSAIGAVAIDPRNNNIVWAGTGETNPRNDVSYGDGIYKSTDGGDKWTNLGLKNTQRISKILIDPANSNHVVVGALGDIYKDSEDRGVYVTDDGGKTWTKSLYVSPASGVSDMAMDAQHPNVMYAGMWHFRREPWTFTSGGDDDGLYKSTDGGHSWTRLTGHGLPDGITGKIGLAVAPSDGNRVYAIIESKEGLLWRSDDGGNNWTMVNKSTLVTGRPFYFTKIAVDTKNPDRVYAIAFQLALSTDAGKTFKEVAQANHVDYHAMWIAPSDPKRAIVGNDGGIGRTVDGGQNWFNGRNYAIGQLYHVGTSLHENPYTICGGWQDNNAWCGPSNSLDFGGIQNKNWIGVNGGDGTWVVPDPIDPNYIWSDSQAGFLLIYNKVTKDFYFGIPYLQDGVQGYDLSKSKYRFNWESPISFAPWDGHTAWLGGNVVFQTTDRARHWTVISPDLTLNDKSHQQPAGGPITRDVSSAEYSDNLLDIEGSQLRRGEIWAGSDDGLIHVTRDGGKHWANVTPAGAPQYGRVETVAPSPLVAGTAYAIFDKHVSGDYHPYIYVTHDWGKSWTTIVKGLPDNQYVRAVRPDIRDRNILYAGTENGIWISLDAGANWQDFKNNLPTVSVHDIRFQPEWNDIVISTHGRSIYVLDDARQVQQTSRAAALGNLMLAPRTAYEYNYHSDDEGTYTDYTGNNPPFGAVVNFYQKTKDKDSPVIEILDASNHVVRTIKGTRKVNGKDVPYVTNKFGWNQYVWDFNIDGPVKWLGAAKDRYQGPNEGIGVPPGRYTVRMKLGNRTFSEHFDVKAAPNTIYTQREYMDGYAFGLKWMQRYSNVNTMLNGLDDIKKQLDAAAADPKAKDNTALQTAIKDALAARTPVFDELTANYQNDEDSLQYPGKLREDLGGLYGAGILAPPVLELAGRLEPRYMSITQKFNEFLTSLAPVNTAIQGAGLKALTLPKPVTP